MIKYRVRLFSVLVVCMIVVFSVLGLFLQQLFESSDQKNRRNTLKRKPNTWLRCLMPAI